MEAKMSSNDSGCCCGGCDDRDKEELRLPGFRFHPTDEELVGFYLKRKVEKRSLRGIDMIIKHVDIYKHDPWDLTSANEDNEGRKSKSGGDDNKECYFYCKRGRKYKNSIRPNRVTGSGFWKATGIDKPIYSSNNNGNNIGDKCKIIGLKKSLVYYRGSAGKGTKTDWMMHEFRLPNHAHASHNALHDPYSDVNDISQEEAEIWTLCRIFKRNKRQNPDWRELSTKKTTIKESSRTSSIDSNTNNYQHYITFASTNNNYTNNTINTIISDDNIVTKAQNMNVIMGHDKNIHHQRDQNQQQWNFVAHTPPSYSSSVNLVADNENDLQPLAYYYGQNNWDDLNSVVEFAVKTPIM